MKLPNSSGLNGKSLTVEEYQNLKFWWDRRHEVTYAYDALKKAIENIREIRQWYSEYRQFKQKLMEPQSNAKTTIMLRNGDALQKCVLPTCARSVDRRGYINQQETMRFHADFVDLYEDGNGILYIHVIGNCAVLNSNEFEPALIPSGMWKFLQQKEYGYEDRD